MPASRWPSRSPPRSTWSDRLARPDAVLGLDMDQHVRAFEPAADLVLQRVSRVVGLLETRPVAELHVQVDIAARARLPGAQLVVADDAAVAEGLDLVLDGLELVVGQGFVDEHAERA